MTITRKVQQDQIPVQPHGQRESAFSSGSFLLWSVEPFTSEKNPPEQLFFLCFYTLGISIRFC